MIDFDRILLALRWSSVDALFALALSGAAYLLLSTEASLWKLVLCLAAIVLVCNWIAAGPDNDNFPGGPPAAA
jgi:hypothetical protein